MLQCFISQCSDDSDSIVNPLVEILSAYFSNDIYKIFCSSTFINPLLPGTFIGNGVKENLQEANCMIAIITDSYLRSPICLAELSAMWFKGEKSNIIPIIYTDEAVKYFKDSYILSDLNYLNAMDLSHAEINAELMLKCLKENGFDSVDDKKLLNELISFFTKYRQAPSARAYIGSSEVFENINQFCYKKGIKQITNGSVSQDIVKAKLADKQELYFVMTTGSSFIDIYSKEYLQKQVAAGASVYMIVPNKNSDFCRDVAFIESPEDSDNNLKRLCLEFDSVVTKLKFIVEEAKAIAKEKNCIGHVYICAAYNLLRQTVCIGKSKDDNCWGWITTTLPPKRASGETPTIVFEGNLSNDDFFGNSVYLHVKQMIEVARKRNGITDLTDDHDFSSFVNDEIADIEERREIEKKWKEKYARAYEFMKKRQRHGNGILIEIAAQHPLITDKPNEEFKARLDFGFQLYQKLKTSGKAVSIYVPGSKHMYKNQADQISLSEAGCNYLMTLGVPKEYLFGEDANIEYMGEYGVYNSCDECYVSANIFKDNGFGKLYCVCSPNQVIRKQLFYLNNKVLPLIYTVSVENMFHDFTDELFESVPTVLYKYPDWSIPECPIFTLSRQERMPGFNNT